MEYPINKGAGKGVEFKGLTTMYLFILAGGLAAVLLAVIVLYLAGVSQGVCIPFGLAAGLLLSGLVFRLNTKYGEHGLMKRLAARRHPRRIIHRRSIRHLIVKRN